MAALTPEQQARETIDEMLKAAGWILQDKIRINPNQEPGIPSVFYFYNPSYYEIN